jgi:hypothetical protein
MGLAAARAVVAFGVTVVVIEQFSLGHARGSSLWGAFMRSGMVLGGDRILVDEAAEPVVSADRGRSRGFEWSC